MSYQYCKDYADTLLTEPECLDFIETTYGGRTMNRALTARIEEIRAILLIATKQQYKEDNLKEDKADGFSVLEDGILKENIV